MKKIIFAIALAMMLTGAYAVNVDTLDIRITVDGSGNAKVAEDYNLKFTSPFEKQEFAQKAIQNSSSIGAWEAENDFFYHHFGGTIESLSDSSITYDGAAKKISFVYSIKGTFARLMTQEQRSDMFVIDDKQLATFVQSGSIVIPDNTTLTIILPSNSEINSQALPENAAVQNNTIILRGLQSNSIEIQYKILKPIAPEGNNLAEFLTTYYTAIILILVVIGAGVYYKRKPIEQKIEDYIVKHSEIKGKLPDSDPDVDMD